MANWETFKLSEITLDQQNYRTGDTPSQRDAISAIIADQEGDKLVNLAEDILAMGGLSPGEPIWVTRDLDNPGMYVVLEGNRRIAALKLMETPKLAHATHAEKGFTELAKQYAAKPIREVEACVFPTRELARPWQRRRHMTQASGVGLQGWTPMAKARADVDQGAQAPRFYRVSEYLRDDGDEWATLSDVLDSKWTTVDRVLNAGSLPTELGINIDLKTGKVTFGNGDVKAGKLLLRRILHEVASPQFKFSDIEHDVDREKFIKRFSPYSVKATTVGKPPVIVAPPPKPTPPPAKPPLTLSARATLAPKTGARTFQVDGDRLNSLYKECRKIIVKDNENASAFLLRVFIELSSEAILVEKNIAIPNAAAKRGLTNWADIGITLPMKVQAVVDYLDPTGKDKRLQQARVARDPSSQATFSINTLHSYFHNRLMKPDAVAIREGWDAWEEYLRMLHASR